MSGPASVTHVNLSSLPRDTIRLSGVMDTIPKGETGKRRKKCYYNGSYDNVYTVVTTVAVIMGLASAWMNRYTYMTCGFHNGFIIIIIAKIIQTSLFNMQPCI